MLGAERKVCTAPRVAEIRSGLQRMPTLCSSHRLTHPLDARSGSLPTDACVTCLPPMRPCLLQGMHLIQVGKGTLQEVVINNFDGGEHPIHLHGEPAVRCGDGIRAWCVLAVTGADPAVPARASGIRMPLLPGVPACHPSSGAGQRPPAWRRVHGPERRRSRCVSHFAL